MLRCLSRPHQLLKLSENQPHFELKNVTVQYGDKVILDHLNWVVQPNQNWWIKGPNGAGKSTLLSLITGDHPQAFANHVVILVNNVVQAKPFGISNKKWVT